MAREATGTSRFKVLDGWRGISILLVLAAHLLPLGMGEWSINAAVGAAGMALFFILSGFLITTSLLRDQNIYRFLVRRSARIVPLAWLVITISFLLAGATAHEWLGNLFFYANWPPTGITEPLTHFWSLCVEMQFYLGVGLLVCLFGKNGIRMLPFACLAITCYRFSDGVLRDIATYYRVDEILAGCILAQLYHSDRHWFKLLLAKLNPLALFPLLILAGHADTGALNYFRPYIAFCLVGSTLFREQNAWWRPWLEGRTLAYIASVSYALYIIHGGLRHTWLGEGELLEKYLKRPLLILATFLLAHISTRYYEAFWIKLGKRITGGVATAKHDFATVTPTRDR